MDDGAPVAKRPKLSDDEEPTAVQVDLPDSALVERILDNSDVWERIFSFMGVRERIQVEMVNKRLRSVMLALWTRETSFDAASVIKELIGDPQKRADGLLAICSRIGDGLRSVKLSDELALDWSKDLSSISNTCPNIESIHFHVEATDLNDSFVVPLNLRFDVFVGLKHLSFSSSSKVDSELGWICAPACVFLSIPCSVESIDRLQGMWNNEDDYFETGQQLEQFFADRPSLRSIRLSRLFTRDCNKTDVFRVIAQHCPLLKKVCLWNSDAINFHGLVSLESMEEICFSTFNDDGDWDDVSLSDAELIEICVRNPLVEVLRLRGNTCVDLGLSALCAVAALKNLRELSIWSPDTDMPEVQVTKFIRQLASNSGLSLRHLDLGCSCHLSTAAIQVLAERCTKLRYLHLSVDEDTTPASIRHLIDCLVADPSWNPNEQKLYIHVEVFTLDDAVLAPFKALTDPAANLPAGVDLLIDDY